ncbi:unnamed protein product [Periconia digitata]|uniref:Uncharacterized protein n=1 Tax=Periconia digitata TaxID=1303443 RepID=A0A9W4U5A8_9PLEO|nr:unnamed protein product [Periconia digitata]
MCDTLLMKFPNEILDQIFDELLAKWSFEALVEFCEAGQSPKVKISGPYFRKWIKAKSNERICEEFAETQTNLKFLNRHMRVLHESSISVGLLVHSGHKPHSWWIIRRVPIQRLPLPSSAPVECDHMYPPAPVECDHMYPSLEEPVPASDIMIAWDMEFCSVAPLTCALLETMEDIVLPIFVKKATTEGIAQREFWDILSVGAYSGRANCECRHGTKCSRCRGGTTSYFISTRCIHANMLEWAHCRRFLNSRQSVRPGVKLSVREDLNVKNQI